MRRRRRYGRHRERDWSGLAIAGFALSLTGCPPIGFVLSLLAFPETRSRKKGRGLAVAGVLVSLVWLAILTIAFVIAMGGVG